MLNICGCLVQTLPERTAAVIATIAATEGSEVHAHDQGRIVVTLEDTETRRACDLLMDLNQIPGVIGVTLTYHHFEALDDSRDAPATLS